MQCRWVCSGATIGFRWGCSTTGQLACVVHTATGSARALLPAAQHVEMRPSFCVTCWLQYLEASYKAASSLFWQNWCMHRGVVCM